MTNARASTFARICVTGDHRIGDGRHFGEMLVRLEEALSGESLQGILDRPNTLSGSRCKEVAGKALGLPASLLRDMDRQDSDIEDFLRVIGF